ncbi:MAG: transposase [Vicinamibacterales bacterium]
MPRAPRAFENNTVLHVVNRGNERRQLFDDGADYADFLRLLRKIKHRHAMRVIAYVVMPNHWHLIVWPAVVSDLWHFMHDLTGAHAARLRIRTGTRGLGHVYQRRYYATALQSDERYLAAIRYVEANPLRARLVRRAEDWPWSSLSERLGAGDLVCDGPVSLPAADGWLTLVNAQPIEQPPTTS